MWYNFLIPLWIVAVGVVVGAALLRLVGALLARCSPQTAAIADVTATEGRSQLLFWVVLGLGTLLIAASTVVPYSTFGDDIKVMKDTALITILVLSAVLAVVTSSLSVSDELEGRTSLTVLSKPVGRRQFVLGKLLGVLKLVFVTYLTLGAVFLAAVSYKVKFENRELSLPPPSVALCQAEMIRSTPALVLAFFETVVLASISVAASMRLAMVPNLMLCATAYVVGHMLPLVVQSAVGKVPIVAFVGQLLSTVLPVLEHFNVQAAIASGRDAMMTFDEWATYLGWAGGYCLLYVSAMTITALLLFDDRDLA